MVLSFPTVLLLTGEEPYHLLESFTLFHLLIELINMYSLCTMRSRLSGEVGGAITADSPQCIQKNKKAEINENCSLTF